MSSKKAGERGGVLTYCPTARILKYLKIVALQGLNNCGDAPACACSIYAKVPELT